MNADDQIFTTVFAGYFNRICALRIEDPEFDELCLDFLCLHKELYAPRHGLEADRVYLANLNETLAELRAEIEAVLVKKTKKN